MPPATSSLSRDQMRIGILITPSMSSEQTKNELIPVTDRRPWLRGVPDKYIIIDDDGDINTTDDVSIGRYLSARLGRNAKVTLIDPLSPRAIDIAREQHVVFLLIYDMLEAFHTLPKRIFRRVERLFRLKNVYPPWSYQRLINHKNAYYAYLRRRGVPVLPFLHLSKASFTARPKAAVDAVMRFAKAHKDEIICKPVYGQESIDFIKFGSPLERTRVEAHAEKMFKTYRGLVYQPYVEALESREYRVFFFGEQPLYLVRTGDDEGFTILAKDARGKRAEIVRFAHTAVKALPPATFRGASVPRLLTRVDVSCCYGHRRWFISELEFVPSLFVDWTEGVLKGVQVDRLLADRMIVLLSSPGFARATGVQLQTGEADGVEGFDGGPASYQHEAPLDNAQLAIVAAAVVVAALLMCRRAP